MTDNKKLIKKIDYWIDVCEQNIKSGLASMTTRGDLSDLTEIKGIVEQHERIKVAENVLEIARELQRIGVVNDVSYGKDLLLKAIKPQPQPDDLVEKIMENLGQFINLKGQQKGKVAFKEEIRKLLGDENG